ncbi:MAG: PIN domain-containing protein [Acidobacteriota bacterium]
MNLYAESSAVLAWLLGEKDGARAYAELTAAELVVSSDLTVLECERALLRFRISGEVTEGVIADRQAALSGASAGWHILHLIEEVLDRARLPFPAEPVRTMDAIHLASALVARSVIPGLALLSLDRRIRSNGRRLGFKVLPR